MLRIASTLNGAARQRRASRLAPPVVVDARVVCGSGGGPDKTILNSPRFLAPLGYRMLCAYMHPPGDRGFDALRHKAEHWQAPLLSIHDRGPWDLVVLPTLLNLCRRERVAIWHGHDYKSNLIGLILCRFWPMRLVTTVHGWVHETRRTPFYYWVDRFCLPHYEKVICVSPDLYERSLASGVAAERCILIENGVDTEEFRRHHTMAHAKALLGIAPERFVIGGIGRLSPEKGFEILIRAVDRLVRGGRDVELLLIGEGAQRAALETLIRDLGLSERVRLLGYQADLRPWYEAMDLFALSSLREGLPNVLLEALAMEVPVVATRIAGIPRLIEHGANGLLVEPGSDAELAQALDQLYDRPHERERFAAHGLLMIKDRYSFAGRMHKIRILYDELLGHRQHMEVLA